MPTLRGRGAPPVAPWSEAPQDERADSPFFPPRSGGRPPRRSGDWGPNPGRRFPKRPIEEDEADIPRLPRRRGDAGSGEYGPPRRPFGSGAQWSEPDDDEWSERPARRGMRPPREAQRSGPRPPRNRRSRPKKPPLTPAEKRRRWFRYLALLGVMGFAALGGAALSFSLMVLGVISLVLCLPCAALFLYF